MSDGQQLLPDSNATFAAHLRDAREARGWNQSELARRMIERGWAKYSQVSVKRTENAERAVRLDEALDLASVLGVSLVSLIGEQSEGDAAPLLALIAEAEDAQNGLRTAAQRLERAQERIHALKSGRGAKQLSGLAQMRLEDALLTPAEYLEQVAAVRDDDGNTDHGDD